MTTAHRGAQTERRGGAGPVRGLLGGKDPTGRLVFQGYQSEPSTSPPEGVTAAHQVSPLRLGASVRTLPSARQTDMPPGWAVTARVGSQSPGVGWTWNFDAGPLVYGPPPNEAWYSLNGDSMGGGRSKTLEAQ